MWLTIDQNIKMKITQYENVSCNIAFGIEQLLDLEYQYVAPESIQTKPLPTNFTEAYQIEVNLSLFFLHPNGAYVIQFHDPTTKIRHCIWEKLLDIMVALECKPLLVEYYQSNSVYFGTTVHRNYSFRRQAGSEATQREVQ